MRVRWNVLVEGTTLAEMRDKANRTFDAWAGDIRYKDSLPPEPIFLDAEMDEVEEGEDGVKRVAIYKAWASRDFEIVDR